MAYSPYVLVILCSLVLSGLCESSLSNQQGVRFIETKNGVYDCVDFYKQPTFLQYPLLKNFTSKVAVVHTTNLGMKFYGVNGSPSLYKPAAQDTQWSSTRIKLLNGPDSIEAGWMVNPGVFKDNEAHFYAKFTAGGKECINLQCPGFVQVAKDAPLGSVPKIYSVIGGVQKLWNISIDKHQDDGNWWLSINNDKNLVGYWPKELFTTLTESANQVEWGGEIGNPGLLDPPTEMGNGMKASYDTSNSACIVHATVVDESFKNVNPQETLKVWDCESLYTVLDDGYQSEYLGRLIFYGGSL
ncbi:uncharacterized protein LOC125496804 [Beta vulgaris subsp. vulgaris]|uniref:uncharacterized protein LOC125496804 n=1 Tax=Beta vulgaris subsp. vulgaris TaxID=3555 RepID=UPI002036C042|nr:uncharacterized protein LOC125496804 [Beta vulgaris subsp. vulgaris]